MMKPKVREFSLRWGLIGIVVSCWLLPMALTLGSLAYYTTQSVRRQFDESVRASISNAAAACRRGMGEAVASSRHASYDGTIRSVYLRYRENENRQMLLYEPVNSFLRQNYRYDDNFLITMIFFVDDPDNIYYTFNPQLNASYSSVLEYQQKTHEEVVRASKDLDTNITFVNSGGRVYMLRNIVDTGFAPLATIVMELNNDAIFGSFRNIVWETGATVYLNGVAVNAGSDEASGIYIHVPENLSLSPGEQAVTEDDGSIFICGRESTDAVDIRYAAEVDVQGFLRGFFDFTGITYMLLFLMVPLLGLSVWFFYRNIFKPMSQLNSAAGEIQDGKLGYQVESRVGNREFKYLNEAFNGMSVRLKQQFERIYSEELALRDARIMALQSQINPHFLNNTLEIINWEVRLGNNAKVSKMIESLSIMLDAAMNRNSSPLVTLAQEMMYVDAYLYIISERFGKRLTVEKRIDPRLLRYEVPRLIMQPIIENAVEHGVDRRQTGVIELIAEKNGGVMTLAVKNNSPMSPKDEQIVARLLSPGYDSRSGDSLHLGIHNVNLRLKMIYGDASGLSIANDGENTVASFAVPLNLE